MALLDKLERRFGFLGIPGLIRIVIGFTALVYVLVYLNRGFESFLTLDPALILRGQVWRLVTYIFIPQTFSPLWMLLALWSACAVFAACDTARSDCDGVHAQRRGRDGFGGCDGAAASDGEVLGR